MMRLKLTKHFQDMIQYRSIDMDHVKKAIKNPEFTKQLTNGRIMARKKVGNGKTIEVIYCKEGFRNSNDHLVITAYYLTA